MEFKLVDENDIDAVVSIMDQARNLMKAEGRNQWTEAYPARSHIESDVAHDFGYAIYLDGRVAAYGAVIAGIEPAYASIDGQWLSEGREKYIVVHRLAVADFARGKGIANKFMEEVENMAVNAGIRWIRVDTNFDNVRMLTILDRLGYTYCGKITYESGERLAYEKPVSISGQDVTPGLFPAPADRTT